VKHLSAFDLDLLEMGGLSAADRAQAEAHLQDCARCRAEREAAAQLRQRFSEHVLPRTLARVTQRRRWVGWKWMPVLLAPALAAAALLFYLRPQGEPEYAFKGGPALTVYARHGDRVWKLRDGQKLQPGDELRFVVAPAGHRYVLVASLDGAGQASIYYPFGGERSAAVASGAELPGSIKLDETLGRERLFALFSDEPLSTADVLRQLKADPAHLPATVVELGFEKQK
jgi:hypothetical protein